MVGELDAAYTREHALEVHVPFLQQVLGDFRLVPIVAGDAPPEAVAAVFDALWGGPETLIVVSTDLSHYLDYAACQRMDTDTAAAIERFDIDAHQPDRRLRGGADARPAAGGAPARHDDRAARPAQFRRHRRPARPRRRLRRLGAARAGDAGERGRRWSDDGRSRRSRPWRPTLLQLVRTGIALGFDTGRPADINPAAASLPPLLAAPGAAFVTLRRNGMLRGCIGSAVATRPLIVDVVQHAFNAAFRDRRFPKLELDELAGLELSVSVLTAPVPMAFADEADLLAQLRPGIDGLIIEDTGRAALFLPSVWEEMREPRQFLTRAEAEGGAAGGTFLPSFHRAALPLDRGEGADGRGAGAGHAGGSGHQPRCVGARCRVL